MKNKKQKPSSIKQKDTQDVSLIPQKAHTQNNIFKTQPLTSNTQQNDNQFEDSTKYKQKQTQYNPINNTNAQNYKSTQNSLEGHLNERQVQNRQSKQISQKAIKQEPQSQTTLNNQSEIAKPTVQSDDNNLKISFSRIRNSPQTQMSSNLQDIESKIKQIAKFIRKKVKNSSPKSRQKILAKNQKTISFQQQIHKIKQINASIIKSKIDSFSSNQGSRSASKLLTFDMEQKQVLKQPLNIIKKIVQKWILQKMWDQIDCKITIEKARLKLDPIKHTYPVSCFKKTILQQSKSIRLRQQQQIRQKQRLLIKRRQIFINSRYQIYSLKKDKKCLQNPQQTRTDHANPNILQHPQITKRDAETVYLLKDALKQIVSQAASRQDHSE